MIPDRKKWTKQERHAERVRWLLAHPQRMAFARDAADKMAGTYFGFYQESHEEPWRLVFRMLRDAGLYESRYLTNDIFAGLRRAVKEAVEICQSNGTG